LFIGYWFLLDSLWISLNLIISFKFFNYGSYICSLLGFITLLITLRLTNLLKLAHLSMVWLIVKCYLHNPFYILEFVSHNKL
jgi:hypothetical protein